MPPPFTCLLLALPAGAYLLSRRWSVESEAWAWTAARCAALLAVGLAAASPFLTDRAVGTGEAYNYSLSVADGIAQLRAGEVPPLVGQSEYAFNGRIHPLRNAPYLTYLTAGFDLLTFHRLSAWELQNLALAFSLIAAVFACYGSLRWGTGCSRTTAFLLATAYGLSPAVLAAAYTANLFMTIHAAAFVPLALGACFRQCRHPSSRRTDALMGAALAATWLAHPPVAYWLTLSVVVVRGLIFLRYPTWGALGRMAGAAALCTVLAGFVLASVAAISASAGFFASGGDFGGAVMPVLRSAFPGSLLPVARSPDQGPVGHFQLGYLGWALLLLLLATLVRPAEAIRRKPRIWWAVLGSVALALLLVSLALPVPWLTIRLWSHSPVSAQSLTNIWPMQRVYLVALGLILFATAVVLPGYQIGKSAVRRTWLTVLALGVAWTAWESVPFIRRGLAMRWSADDTARSHLSSNIDLTVTAYSFLATPPTFVNGVMDPQFEFRLLRGGRDEIDSPLRSALRTAPLVARGVFPLIGRPAPALEVGPQKLTLQPGRRYLLTFSFHTPPLPGWISVIGPSVSRRYRLPAAGGPEGFGMQEGNRHTLSLWTPQSQAEEVEIGFKMDDWPGRPAALREFAGYTVQEVEPDRLPIRLDALIPLRFAVDAPDDNDYVDTPRRWLPGYVANVDGRQVDGLRSPLWDVMVPVPRGRSVVELRYPGSLLVRAAFWLSVAGWLGFLTWAGRRLGPAGDRRTAPSFLARTASWPIRHPWPVLAALVIGGAIAIAVVRWTGQAADLSGIGPVRVTFLLPFHQSGSRQPIVTTGRSGAGSTVFLHYLDEGHLRVGADIWGNSFESEPIEVNYFRQQNLVVDSSALYPLDDAPTQALPPAERERLRGNFRVELNGRVVLDLARAAYDSKISEVAVGENTIGSSGIEPRFGGEVLRAKRLPVSRRWILLGDQRLALRLRFPSGHVGATEPLLALGPDGRDGYATATYLAGGQLRLSVLSSGGQAVASALCAFAPGRSYRLEFSLGQPATGSAPAVGIRLDGAEVIKSAQTAFLAVPEMIELGVAPRAPAGLDARFTGAELSLDSPVPGAVPPPNGSGPMRIVAILPKGKPGRQEPLLTTGRNGRGDFIYVVYLDAHHIKLGFDHWGVSGGLSDPIPLDYDQPHAFAISLGSLYPGETDTAWAGVPPDQRQRLKSEMTVQLDGHEAYRAAFTAHPSAPNEIVVGRNDIGGSSCDPAFTGVLFSAERLGLPGTAAP